MSASFTSTAEETESMLGAGGEIDPFDFSYYMDQVSRCLVSKCDQNDLRYPVGSVDGAIKQSFGVSSTTVYQTWREICYRHRHGWLLYVSSYCPTRNTKLTWVLFRR